MSFPAGAGAKVAAVTLAVGVRREQKGRRENRHLTAAFQEDELDIPPGCSGSTALWDTGSSHRPAPALAMSSSLTHWTKRTFGE